MKRLYLIIFFLIAAMLGRTLEVAGQLNTKVSLSNPYASQAAEFKKAHKASKAYKKMIKDSLKTVKRLNKVYKYKIDSLVNYTTKPSEEYTGYKIPAYDSATFNALTFKHNSQWIAYQQLYGEGLPDSVSTIDLDQYTSNILDQSTHNQLLTKGIRHKDKVDSLGSETYLKDKSQAYISDQSSKIEEELVAYSGIDGLPASGVPDMGNGVPAPNTVIPSGQLPFRKDLKQSMKQITSGQLGKYSSSIETAHKTMASLKKKYITVPSLGDLRSATKRNSLSSLPFKKRLKVGGNFHIKQSNSIDIDFSPSLAYRLNRKSSTGIAGTYRSSFGGDNELKDAFNPRLYGISIFLEMALYKSFYGRADIESLHNVNGIGSAPEKPPEIITGALAGIGRSFGLGKKVNGKISVQYNFLHQDNGLYSSPWVFRFGFDLKELGKKRIGIGNLKKK